MREDIVAGLKNAMQRGESLEKAVQSFINAGYNPMEVKQAAESIYEGAISITHPDSERKIIPQQLLQQHIIQSENKQVQETKIQTKPRGKGGNIVLIIILVLILLTLLGGLIYIIFYGQDLLDKLIS